MNCFPLLSARVPRGTTLVCASALSAVVLAGCGSVGNTDSARIRAVDAATDSGTVNVLVNGSASYGDQTYFMASNYFYLSTGSSSFSAIVNTQTTSASARFTKHSLSSGRFYTAYLVGRPTAPTPAAPLANDSRYSEVLVTDDTKPALTSGQAAVRIIDAAPDAGGVDVLVNGSTQAPSVVGLTFPKAGTVLVGTTSTPDDPFVGTYVPVTAGTLSVKVNATGTSTALIPATNVSVQAGRGYTLLVTEPTSGTAVTGTTGGTPPSYVLQTTTE